MNGVHAPHQGRRPRLWSGLRALALVSFAFLAASCDGGSASPGVASIGSTTSTTSALGTAASFGAPGLQQSYKAQLAYAACMRSHGEPSFPDPVLTGQSVRFGPGRSIDQDSPRFISASTTCKRLVPDGGVPSPAQIQALIAQMVKNAECMPRARGNELPGPDRERPRHVCRFQPQRPGPKFPQFQAAQRACQKLAPFGGGG